MGFLLSILYLLTYYLTPTVMFGPIAQFRVELILAIILMFVSLPALLGRNVFRAPQVPAIIGLAFATFMSMLVGAKWAGGGLNAFLLFIPNAFAFFIVYIHCTSKLKLRVLVLLMLFVCFFIIAQGAYELHQGLPQGHAAETANANMRETYFLGMNNEAGEWFYRLRGKGQIDDPNDFAQIIVCSLPLTFLFWKKKRAVRNLFFVLVPVGVLIWGVYLTHSRGGIVGLLAVVIMAARRKIRTVPAILLGVLLFVGISATNFAGGRDISASAGEDRTELWGDGLQLLKSHPVFGVGFEQMPEYFGHTAHNTIVVCAAELGFCGLFFWSLFLLPSLKDTGTVAFRKKETDALPVVYSDTSYPLAAASNAPDEAEIVKFAQLLVLSYVGFLATGWFLSRAYVLTLFLLGGFTEAIYEMARSRGMVPERMRFGRLFRYSAIMAVGLVVMMYVLLRVVNLTR